MTLNSTLELCCSAGSRVAGTRTAGGTGDDGGNGGGDGDCDVMRHGEVVVTEAGWLQRWRRGERRAEAKAEAVRAQMTSGGERRVEQMGVTRVLI